MAPRRLASQLGRPSGFVGRQVAREMALVNRSMIASAVAALDVRSGDVVVEVGFAAGRTLAQLAALAAPGRVIGIDHSPAMVAMARRRNRRAARSGSVVVLEGDAGSLPVDDTSADRVLSVNCLTYWPEPQKGLAEVRRALRPGGRCVVSVREPASLRGLGVDTPGVVEREELLEMARGAGLHAAAVLEDADRLGAYFHLVAPV